MDNQPRTPIPTHRIESVSIAFQLRYHFGFATYRRQPNFTPPAIDLATEHLQILATKHQYHLIEFAFQADVLRCLVSLRPEQTPESFTRTIKGNLATSLRPLGIHKLWSRGTFARSNGTVDDKTITDYLAKQAQHHRAIPDRVPDYLAPCSFVSANDSSQLQRTAHAVYQNNLHFVFSVTRRQPILDPIASEFLIAHWKRVCAMKGWTVWSISVVPDHGHLMIGVPLNASPAEIALSLMNNSEHEFAKRYRGYFKEYAIDQLWTSGFYVGTVGAATTDQIAGYLRNLPPSE